MDELKYKGKDNDGNLKSDYLAKLTAMTDDQLRHECNDKIWLSAYASNNPRSDFHWQCDACYDECKQRNRPDIYTEEHAKLTREARGY